MEQLVHHMANAQCSANRWWSILYCILSCLLALLIILQRNFVNFVILKRGIPQSWEICERRLRSTNAVIFSWWVHFSKKFPFKIIYKLHKDYGTVLLPPLPIKIFKTSISNICATKSFHGALCSAVCDLIGNDVK